MVTDVVELTVAELQSDEVMVPEREPVGESDCVADGEMVLMAEADTEKVAESEVNVLRVGLTETLLVGAPDVECVFELTEDAETELHIVAVTELADVRDTETEIETVEVTVGKALKVTTEAVGDTELDTE